MIEYPIYGCTAIDDVNCVGVSPLIQIQISSHIEFIDGNIHLGSVIAVHLEECVSRYIDDTRALDFLVTLLVSQIKFTIDI
jgi:hypothetical protein